jgi:hypothetical protein
VSIRSLVRKQRGKFGCCSPEGQASAGNDAKVERCSIARLILWSRSGSPDAPEPHGAETVPRPERTTIAQHRSSAAAPPTVDFRPWRRRADLTGQPPPMLPPVRSCAAHPVPGFRQSRVSIQRRNALSHRFGPPPNATGARRQWQRVVDLAEEQRFPCASHQTRSWPPRTCLPSQRQWHLGSFGVCHSKRLRAVDAGSAQLNRLRGGTIRLSPVQA